jgi:histidine triad (HIT) family protein
MDDCIFCGIVAGRIPARIVAEDERTVTFLDIHPANRGHCLVIPRAHARDVVDIAPDELAACARAAQRAARRTVEVLGAPGVNLLNSSGTAAWQTVFHFHVHVIPRYAGDPLVLPWQPHPADPAQLDEVAAVLREDVHMP